MGLKLIARAVMTVALVTAALGIAGCGSSRSSSRSSASSSGRHVTGLSAPLRVYRVLLAGRAETPHGAVNGSGDAVIAIHSGSVVCWRFAHLHGFLNATVAHIHAGRATKSGTIVVPLFTGPHLHHQGCVHSSAVVVKAIEEHPAAYYVNVHSLQYPAGAVRAQL